MNIPSLGDLKTKIMGKVTDSVMEKVGMGSNPFGGDFSGVTSMLSGFDLESFNKLSTAEKISKGLTYGGAGVAGLGLLGLIGKSSGVDFLAGFSDKTFPIALGVGAAALLVGLAIPMYKKYQENEANKDVAALGVNQLPKGTIQLLDSSGVVIKEANVASIMNTEKLSPDFISSKIQTMDNKFTELDKPKISHLAVPRPA